MNDARREQEGQALLEALDRLQTAYATYLQGLDRLLTLDPRTSKRDVEAIHADLGNRAANVREAIDAALPLLRVWKAEPERVPKDVSDYTRQFMDLFTGSMSQALGQVQSRLTDVSSKAKEIRERLESMNKQRRGLSGYRSGVKQAPNVIDSET